MEKKGRRSYLLHSLVLAFLFFALRGALAIQIFPLAVQISRSVFQISRLLSKFP